VVALEAFFEKIEEEEEEEEEERQLRLDRAAAVV
jgi:hypothetical protein